MVIGQPRNFYYDCISYIFPRVCNTVGVRTLNLVIWQKPQIEECLVRQIGQDCLRYLYSALLKIVSVVTIA